MQRDHLKPRYSSLHDDVQRIYHGQEDGRNNQMEQQQLVEEEEVRKQKVQHAASTVTTGTDRFLPQTKSRIYINSKEWANQGDLQVLMQHEDCTNGRANKVDRQGVLPLSSLGKTSFNTLPFHDKQPEESTLCVQQGQKQLHSPIPSAHVNLVDETRFLTQYKTNQATNSSPTQGLEKDPDRSSSSNQNQLKEEMILFDEDVMKDVLEFNPSDVLGEGTYAKVVSGIDKVTGEAYAVKMVRKDGLISEKEKLSALEEIAVLRILSHPNIVKLLKAYSIPGFYLLVLERIRGTSLVEYAMKNGHLQNVPEPIAQQILGDVVDALHYLHNQVGIIHGDVKLGNIMLAKKKKKKKKEEEEEEEEDSNEIIICAKLCDFGNATRVGQPTTNMKTNMKMKTTTCLEDEAGGAKEIQSPPSTFWNSTYQLSGTMGYMAPECLRLLPSSFASDMWALGIVAFELLGGYKPFYPYISCMKEKVVFPEREFKGITGVGIDFVKRLLEVDPSKRMTASQARSHAFLNKRRG